jgi:hypothetical protein
MMMRIGAAVVALAALVSLGAQWMVSNGLMAGEGQWPVLWRMLGYFTVLANLATLALLGSAAISGRIDAKTAAAITVVMAVVGIGYHALLAGIWAHQGLAWWADQGLHTAVPVLAAMWWVAFAPKAGLVGRDAFKWLVWPIGYAAYALLRGSVSGFYPYPFLDVSKLGLAQSLLNIGVLGLCFVMLGLLLIGIARLIR